MNQPTTHDSYRAALLAPDFKERNAKTQGLYEYILRRVVDCGVCGKVNCDCYLNAGRTK